MSDTITTTDHNVIRKWALARGGRPAHIKGTGHKNDPGMLRINFPGYSGETTLEDISWDEFFEKFDENSLAVIIQNKTDDGRVSRFNKFVSDDGKSSYSRRG